MGRGSTVYKDFVARIHSTANDMIEAAMKPKLSAWLKEQPEIRQCIKERSETIDIATARVHEIDPQLSVSGPIISESRLVFRPNWVKELNHWALWYRHYGTLDAVVTSKVTHKPILKAPGGAFNMMAKRYHMETLCNDEQMTLQHEGDLIIMSEAARNTILWADKQYRLLFGEFNEWTKQFKEYTQRRAIDLSFYFSPLFASFAQMSRAKVFSQRPRVDDYTPMTQELATLLTMVRASTQYTERRWDLTR
jgi:hypothetical protein